MVPSMPGRVTLLGQPKVMRGSVYRAGRERVANEKRALSAEHLVPARHLLPVYGLVRPLGPVGSASSQHRWTLELVLQNSHAGAPGLRTGVPRL